MWQGQSDIWGGHRSSEGDLSPWQFRWPEQYFDSETGLHYNRYRYYDPDTGTYCSTDPLGLAGGPRPYAYVADVLAHSEPHGLMGNNACGNRAANAGDDVVRALSATQRRTLDDALRPDKLDHIFDPKHNFQPLVQEFGSREATMQQIVRSIGGRCPKAGRFEIAQSIRGQTVVYVAPSSGAVVDGIPRIGTAFTP